MPTRDDQPRNRGEPGRWPITKPTS
jgi:hypothetical protein